MALDALSLLDELGWKDEVHLVGYSMGGAITQELALLDLPRFSSLSLLSTIQGGSSFMFSIPSVIVKLASIFLSSSPQENALQVVYPQTFLKQTSVNPETGRMELNLTRFGGGLQQREKKRQAAGIPDIPLCTIFKQFGSCVSHYVDNSRLKKMGAYFGAGVLVVTGDEDILVNCKNSEMLAHGLIVDGKSGGQLLVLPGAGHGANEQCADAVCAAIRRNIERGVSVRKQAQQRAQTELARKL
jgi:pimeloyl-ACP methyl ester carboxylesterase